jgi:hypothetical protein
LIRQKFKVLHGRNSTEVTLFLKWPCYISADDRTEKSLLEELSTSIYMYITRGEYPMWYKDRPHLVEYGLARFIGKGDEVIVEEPMALVSVVRHFETKGFTLGHDIRSRMQAAKGQAFEETVLLACTKLFRRGARLDSVFRFHGETPAWACQEASIVSRKDGDTLEVFDIVNGDPVIPSAGIAYYAKGPKDVQRWIKSMSTGWCLPGKNMGPDLMAWLRLKDGRLLLLLVQAKCHLSGNIDTVAAGVTADAIHSLSPASFFASLVCTRRRSVVPMLTIYA